LAGLQSGGMSQQQSYEMINRVIDQQAFMLSANDIFYVSALLFLLLIGVVWLARPVKAGAVADTAAGAH
jgi:MFS transporter, DHA2 family, multidrug resistance protein